MKLLLERFLTTDKSTIGVLMVDARFACYTLEDPHHDVKIYGETRIPEGKYQLKLRTFGGFNQRYTKRFMADHFGMLEICDVPGFENVLMHIGNGPEDTEGCVLLGSKAGHNYIYDSTVAYRKVYPTIAHELSTGKEVTLEIVDN